MLIDLSAARAHLRLEDDYPAPQLQVYIAAAETAAAEFMNRKIFASEGERDDAVAAVPGLLVEAVAAHEAALAAADLVVNWDSRCAARDQADAVLRAARANAAETCQGIIVNDLMRAAIMLVLGDLFENRADAPGASIPTASQRLLQPYRVGLGV